MRECWQTVFMRRYKQRPLPGEAPLLSFVKLFSAGVTLAGKSRQELISDKETFFYHWLKLAGVKVLE